MTSASRNPGYRSLRKGRCSLPGHVYLITTVTRHRRPVFGQWHTASTASRTLGDPALWHPHRCLCWVLMPDHWHGLIELGDQGSLSAVVRTAKSESARRIAHHSGHVGSLWMPGFHDHALRASENARAAARYIVANPLRAGLVDNVLHYPYWDAVWLDSRANCSILT